MRGLPRCRGRRSAPGRRRGPSWHAPPEIRSTRRLARLLATFRRDASCSVTSRAARLSTVTDSLSLNTSPAWSPDGKWLYFVSSRDGRRDIYMEAIGANGNAVGAPVRLSVGLGAHTISLSGTGSQLAYSLYTARTSAWSIPVPTQPGGDVDRVQRGSPTPTNTSSSSALRSDGKWLYYDSDLTGNDDIFRIPIAGGEAERLTTDPADDFAPAPSPDGKSFAFHSWRSGSRDIYVQRTRRRRDRNRDALAEAGGVAGVGTGWQRTHVQRTRPGRGHLDRSPER